MSRGFRADGMPAGGRRAGARNKLSTKFLEALAADFEEGGADAIKLCRIESPEKYIQIVASILPKELDVTHNQLGELDDDELAALLQHVRELRAQPVIEQAPIRAVVEGKNDRAVDERRIRDARHHGIACRTPAACRVPGCR
jgi:hypothetical protein